MRVLLISANRAKSPFPVYPLGLAYVDACLKRRGYETRFVDVCFAEAPIAQVYREITAFHPDCIAISIRNIDDLTYGNTVQYLPAVRELARACRQTADVPVVVGGAGFSVLPRPILDFLELETGFVGEAEESLPAWLGKDRGSARVPGEISRRLPGEVEPARVPNLDALPFPTRDHELARTYERNGGVVNVQTKRGCPFRCVYCNYPRLEGRAYRLRSPGHVVEELVQLRARGVRKVHFVDSVFTAPSEHAQAICEEMLRRQVRMSWTCGANPLSMPSELVTTMKRAGCSGVELGIDAADDSMLTSLRKGFDWQTIKDCDARCDKAGLPVMYHLIFGGPGETVETMNASVDAMRELRPRAITYSLGLRVFPGTRIEQMLLERGELHEQSELLEPRFYLSPALTPSDCEALSARLLREPRWLPPTQRDSAMAKWMLRLGARLGLQGPIWRYAPLMSTFKNLLASPALDGSRTGKTVAVHKQVSR